MTASTTPQYQSWSKELRSLTLTMFVQADELSFADVEKGLKDGGHVYSNRTGDALALPLLGILPNDGIAARASVYPDTEKNYVINIEMGPWKVTTPTNSISLTGFFSLLLQSSKLDPAIEPVVCTGAFRFDEREWAPAMTFPPAPPELQALGNGEVSTVGAEYVFRGQTGSLRSLHISTRPGMPQFHGNITIVISLLPLDSILDRALTCLVENVPALARKIAPQTSGQSANA